VLISRLTSWSPPDRQRASLQPAGQPTRRPDVLTV